jgi:hypothetical protein
VTIAIEFYEERDRIRRSFLLRLPLLLSKGDSSLRDERPSLRWRFLSL